MKTLDSRFRSFRILSSATCLALTISSCALFHAERVGIRSLATETFPPTPIAPGQTIPGSPGGPAPSAPSVVFQPGASHASGGRPPYASDEGVTTGVIRLGTIQPMDGPASQLGRPLYRATQAYVNALNARGGINGRLVQLFLQTACLNCEDENLLAAK